MRALLFLAILIPAYAAALDAPEIIRRSVIANNEDWEAFPRYTHKETDINSKIDARGEPISKTSRTYQVLMIDGSPYENTIRVNGTALSADQQKREEAKLRAEIARRQRESSGQRQARIAKYSGERQSERFLMNEMIHAFQFKLVGEDQLEGHPVYVLDAAPRPDYRPPNQKARVLTGMKGRIWVEKQQYHWVKVQAEVTHPVSIDYLIAKVSPGTRFELDQAPVAGGLWFPTRFVENVNARILAIKARRTREEDLFSDYRPASSEPLRR